MTATHSAIDYPTSDGRPMAETDLHCLLTIDTRQTLGAWYANDPNVYVSGNLLLYYVEGDKRRHVAPDVFVVKGVAKQTRECYLLWAEGKSPDMAIELTSSSTRKEDTGKKFLLYQDVLKVREYFLFDPTADYLKPSLQGFRLSRGKYIAVSMVENRLPSKVLGLHLERRGTDLRFFDPQKGEWLLTVSEKAERERARAEQERARADQERKERLRTEANIQALEKENQELRAQIEALKRKP